MIEIKEVITKSDIKKFINFPHKLYKGVPYFVPFLNVDEKNKFNPEKNESFDDCIVKSFIAIKDGKVVGRICGIIQKLYMKKQIKNECVFQDLTASTMIKSQMHFFLHLKNGQKSREWRLFMDQWATMI